jgi:uncharacterized protein YggE
MKSSSGGNTVIAIVLGFVVICGMTLAAGVYVFERYMTSTTEVSTLSAEGTASLDVPQTTATTMIYVEVENVSQEAANTEAEEALSNLVDFLLTEGFTRDDLVTNSSLEERPEWYYYREGRPEEQENVFVARASIELTIDDVKEREDTVGALLDEVVSLGATSVQPLQYDIEDKEAKCRDLSNDALRAARVQANERVQALGGEGVVRVTQVEVVDSCDQGFYPYPVFMDRSAAGVAEDSEAPVSAPRISGETELSATATITVEYR